MSYSDTEKEHRKAQLTNEAEKETTTNIKTHSPQSRVREHAEGPCFHFPYLHSLLKLVCK